MSHPIGLCFCHGWGFTPDYWKPLLPHFETYPILQWNLGYEGKRHCPAPDSSANQWIAIGHSIGFRHLMENHSPWAGAVAVQGFHDFLGKDPRLKKIRHRSLTQMIERWKQNPEQVLQTFYETCQLPQKSRPPKVSNFRWLESDLLSLATPGKFDWPLAIPHRILAARDDLVVSPRLMESEWKWEEEEEGETDKIRWSETGGHGLGFFESDFVAESIHTLIREVLESRRS